MNMEKVATNIKFLREQNDMTQQDLAAKLATSRSVISKWENNVVTPDLSSLISLSNIFHITLDHLVMNHTLREDLLKDVKQLYSSKNKSIDVEMVDIIEYLLIKPKFRDTLYRLQRLPLKKQSSAHIIFENLIEEYEHL